MTEPVLVAAGVCKSFRQGPEILEVLRGVWNEVPFAYQGKHFTARGVASLPAPAQPGGPPTSFPCQSGRPRGRSFPFFFGM